MGIVLAKLVFRNISSILEMFRNLVRHTKRISFTQRRFVQSLVPAAYTSFLRSSEKLRSELMDEAVSMLVPEGMSAPELNKGFFYFQRTDDETGLVRFCRVPSDVGGNVIDTTESSLEEEILNLADIRRTFSKSNFCSVAVAKICVDNKFVGFVSDVVGDEKWILRFRDITKKTYLQGSIDFVRNFEWMDNTLVEGRFLYYTSMDPITLRSNKIWKAELKDGQIRGRTLIWEETNDDSYLDLVKSKDGECIFFSSSSKTKSEVRVVSATDPSGLPQLVEPPQNGVEYYCEHSDGYIYMVSNKEYTNFALYRKKLSSSAFELVHHSTLMSISDLDVFRRGIVLYGTGFEGEPAVDILRVKKFCNPNTISDSAQGDFGDSVSVPFKGNYNIGKLEISVNGDYESEKCRFYFRSPKNPGTCLEVDFYDRKIEAIKSREFQRKWVMMDINVSRVMVGPNNVPLTVVSGDESLGPCLVHVYGAYGTVLEPDFSPAVLSLVRRGWTVAFVHVRGGGEKGAEWHQAGMGLNRWNGVDDFKTCCDWLVKEGITTHQQLSAVGASAGGLILGAALNKWGSSLIGGPSILRVPFVDLFDTLSDPSLPLSVHEREEWGDVNKNPAFIHEISPIDNIVSQGSNDHWYPPLLISCAENDTRVPFEGVVRYANKLVASGNAHPNTLLNTRGTGGHFGADDYEETCAELAFLINQSK